MAASSWSSSGIADSGATDDGQHVLCISTEYCSYYLSLGLEIPSQLTLLADQNLDLHPID